MKLRTRLMVSVCAAAALTLAACGGGSESASSTTTAAADGEVGGTVSAAFAADFKAAFEPAVQSFQQKYPNAELKVDYQGGDILTALSTQLQAGTAPDIFLTLPGGAPGAGGGMTTKTLASQQRLYDLSDSSWAPEIPEAWRDDMTLDGKTYSYPGALQGIGAMYNLTTMKELGLAAPKTYDEVLQLCSAAKDKGLYAYGIGMSDGAHMGYLALISTLLYGPNPEWDQQQKDGQVKFQDSTWVDAMTKYKEMYDAGCFGEGALGASRAQAGDAVAAGKALAIVDVGAYLATLAKGAPNDEFILEPLPATNEADKQYMPALPGFTISVNAETENPAAAKAYLEELHAHVGEYATAFSSVPVIPTEGFTPAASLSSFNELVASGQYSKLPTGPAEVQVVAIEQVQALMLGEASVNDVLTKMQDAYDAGNTGG